MTHHIEINNETYERLGKLAIGFDSPESVIIRLLEIAEGKTVQKPQLVFVPDDEEEFKAELLQTKEAEITLYKNDGSRSIQLWNAQRLQPRSNLRANLWSGQLRGWQEKGIVKAEIEVLPISNNHPDDSTKIIKLLASDIGVKFSEFNEVIDHCNWDNLGVNESNDGLLYNFILEFDDECPQDFLDKIRGLNDNRWIEISPNLFDEPDF